MRHLGMYLLLNGNSMANWVPRWGLPSLIPFILEAQVQTHPTLSTVVLIFLPGRSVYHYVVPSSAG